MFKTAGFRVRSAESGIGDNMKERNRKEVAADFTDWKRKKEKQKVFNAEDTEGAERKRS